MQILFRPKDVLEIHKSDKIKYRKKRTEQKWNKHRIVPGIINKVSFPNVQNFISCFENAKLNYYKLVIQQ